MTTTAAASAPDPRRRPRDRKQQILVAARDLFVERGYPNVSMALISERVGITAGALYRHFKNKAVLLEQVMDANFAWVDDLAPRAEAGYAIEDAISWVIDRPYLPDLWTHEIRYLPEVKLQALRRRMLTWSQALTPALRNQRPDLDQRQQELIAWAIQSVLSCLGRRNIRSPMSVRLLAVRSALRAVAAAELVPVGTKRVSSPPRLAPVSMRERLLIAAFEQFATRGYQDTSMADIAAAADVTASNCYGYFESKADLLRAVYDRGTHALWIGLDQALAAQSPHEALDEAARSYIRVAGSWSSILDDSTGEPGLREASLAAQREYVAEWVALLGRTFPELQPRQARARVQIALFLVTDLYRNQRISRYASFHQNLTSLVLAVLHDRRTLSPAS